MERENVYRTFGRGGANVAPASPFSIAEYLLRRASAELKLKPDKSGELVNPFVIEGVGKITSVKIATMKLNGSKAQNGGTGGETVMGGLLSAAALAAAGFKEPTSHAYVLFMKHLRTKGVRMTAR